jgi:hypothetical protein
LEVHDDQFVDAVRTIRVLTLVVEHIRENFKSLFAVGGFIDLDPLI